MTPGLAGLLAMICAGLALRGLVLVRDKDAADRLGLDVTGIDQPSRTRELVERIGAQLGPRLMRALGETARARARRRLDLAGRPGGMTVEQYFERKAAFGAIGLLTFLLLTLAGGAIAGLLLLVVALLGLDMSLSRAARTRQERLERDLPDFLDILAVTVRAGAGYGQALQRVAAGLGGPVGEEIGIALRQMELGASRREALSAMRDRSSADAVQMFVAAQLQADDLGVPLADALNSIARDMRREANQHARRRAQRAAPRVSLIIIALIVPASIILILAALLLQADLGGSGILGR
ncbi:MAG TPA: DUF5936 domain-containing protein [Solirubrobacteraceae bacterium]|nr:DUF5936 domain-containing protein [Solirubrobacteraceae bacterium]